MNIRVRLIVLRHPATACSLAVCTVCLHCLHVALVWCSSMLAINLLRHIKLQKIYISFILFAIPACCFAEGEV